MACETACPSGVRYAPLIEQTRAAIEQHHERPAGERWFRRLLFASALSGRLRLLTLPLALVGPLRRAGALHRCFPRGCGTLLALAPSVTLSTRGRETPELTPAVGDRRAGRSLDRLRAARVFRRGQPGDRTRARRGRLRGPRAARQGCCGALALHAGEDETARGVRAAAHRSRSSARRRRHRRQRGRLRVGDEGIRSPAARRSGVGRARAGVFARRSAT